MKTEQLLESKNKGLLNKALNKIPSLKGINTKDVDCLASAIHNGMWRMYGYKVQYLTPFFANNKFVHYTMSILSESGIWRGNVYGSDLWECFAKAAIKIYSLAKEDEKRLT